MVNSYPLMDNFKVVLCHQKTSNRNSEFCSRKEHMRPFGGQGVREQVVMWNY